MQDKGIRLIKFMASGDDKESAVIEFKPGLNVVAYMSQTGKSYILECINFLMGGKTLPRKIKQSLGYTTLWLEFEDFGGATHVLMRTVNADDFRLYSMPLENIESGTNFKKMAKSANAKSSASRLIAELSGFAKAKLKSNRWNHKANLSFRTISHFFIVDEISMIGDLSPVNSRGGFALTTEKSAFKYLITGVDDSELEEVEGTTPEQITAFLQHEVLQKLIGQIASEIKAKDAHVNAVDHRDLENQLAVRAADIAEITRLVRARETDRRSAWSQIQERQSRQIVLDELTARFSLLGDHYASDLQRLDFISEGKHYLDQLETVACPMCGTALDSHSLQPCTPSTEADATTHQFGYAEEAAKIRRHVADLEGTVESIVKERVEVTAAVGGLRTLIEQIDTDLSTVLAPRLSTAKDAIEQLAFARSESLYVKTLSERLVILEAERDELGKVSEAGDGDAQVYIDERASSEFCGMMRWFLEQWHFMPSGGSVEFDANKFDFIVDGQARGDNGKGVRALIHAAFNIALMRYCLAKNLSHTRCVLIDSPLTTFKERDRVAGATADEVTGEVQTAFFANLAKIQENEQIIVFENKQPPTTIADTSHYVEFVGYELEGRAGFFPVTKTT